MSVVLSDAELPAAIAGNNGRFSSVIFEALCFALRIALRKIRCKHCCSCHLTSSSLVIIKNQVAVNCHHNGLLT